MKYKVVFQEGTQLEIDNVGAIDEANDVFFMARDEKIIFMAPKETVLYIVEVKADTAER